MATVDEAREAPGVWASYRFSRLMACFLARAIVTANQGGGSSMRSSS